MRAAVVTLVVVVCAAGVVLGLLWLGQRSLIYFPSGDVPPVDRLLPAASAVTVHTADGLDLGAWYLPPPAEGATTVLVLPGNAGARDARVPLAEALHARGMGVLLLDYRGFGGNPGRPSEAGLALDARAARRHLVAEQGVAPGDLVYYGESIGAAVAAELATEHPPAGLVLRSPFTSLADVAAVHYPLLPAGLLLRDRFEVAERMADVRVPTAVVLGTADGIVPPPQSRAVAQAAAGPVRVVEVEGAGHNSRALLDGDALVEAVAAIADDG